MLDYLYIANKARCYRSGKYSLCITMNDKDKVLLDRMIKRFGGNYTKVGNSYRYRLYGKPLIKRFIKDLKDYVPEKSTLKLAFQFLKE